MMQELEQELVTKQPAVIQAELLFQEALRSGRHSAGASIKESVLAREYDLPRTAIREMLNQAVQWNLVEYAAYRGFRIREFTIRDAWEWCTLREGIEPVAARLLAQNCPPEVFEQLREACRRMELCADPTSQEAWNQDIAFHSTIVRCCGNQCIAGLHTRIYLPAHFYYEVITRQAARILAVERQIEFDLENPGAADATRRNQQGTLFWHRKMLEAIEAKQEKLTEYLFREHLHDIRVKHEILYRKSLRIETL